MLKAKTLRQIKEAADRIADRKGRVYAEDLQAELGVCKATALRYLVALVNMEDWHGVLPNDDGTEIIFQALGESQFARQMREIATQVIEYP